MIPFGRCTSQYSSRQPEILGLIEYSHDERLKWTLGFLGPFDAAVFAVVLPVLLIGNAQRCDGRDCAMGENLLIET